MSDYKALTDEQLKKLNKARPTKVWRGVYSIFAEVIEKYPDIDEDYLIGILGECLDGGEYLAKDRFKSEILELLDD